ncbi:DNA-binding transcriptional ArsR family regulator [Micromonospora pisi]|uniref:DNA-binding transcriptional ArsR family regulator n=1 Tax=Micromonospora pisi TaxID=589240 RepID=A0A495JTU9_9ACTN|nr:winged helix-turn-helix domain-containing protein [Micromonospora pisi]RKR91794.1 DNA-binding transcriptional ArsR family regulator [Micromonospora pisi]
MSIQNTDGTDRDWRRPRDPDRAYLTDPRAIRVLAHPGRQGILRRLQADGPATATECAQVAGMTPSAASYHLRQLARHGFVAEAPGRGDMRERMWEARIRGYRIDDVEEPSAQLVATVQELFQATLQASEQLAVRWMERLPQESYAWRDSAQLATKSIRVNPAELRVVYERMAEILQPYLANRRPREDAPADARLVHVDLRMLPWADPAPVVAVEPAEPKQDGREAYRDRGR